MALWQKFAVYDHIVYFFNIETVDSTTKVGDTEKFTNK